MLLTKSEGMHPFCTPTPTLLSLQYKMLCLYCAHIISIRLRRITGMFSCLDWWCSTICFHLKTHTHTQRRYETLITLRTEFGGSAQNVKDHHDRKRHKNRFGHNLKHIFWSHIWRGSRGCVLKTIKREEYGERLMCLMLNGCNSVTIWPNYNGFNVLGSSAIHTSGVIGS